MIHGQIGNYHDKTQAESYEFGAKSDLEVETCFSLPSSESTMGERVEQVNRSKKALSVYRTGINEDKCEK